MLNANKSTKQNSVVPMKSGKSKLYFGLLLLQFFSVSENIDAQSPDSPPWAWVKTLSSTSGIFGNAVSIDPKQNGDIYIAGGFEGTADFDPGPGTFYLASGSPQDVGIFVSKFDGSGNFVWAKRMVRVGSGAAFAGSMAIDPADGAIYTTGLIQGTIDFDPGLNTFNLTSVGNSDIFISKLDSEGNFVWAKVMGGPEEDFGSSLAIDRGGSGDVYITGQFRKTVDFDPGDSTFNLTSAGNSDIFISKLSSSGNLLWAKTNGGTGYETGRAIAFDPAGDGKVYTRGYFEKTVDFDPGKDTYDLTAVAGQENFIFTLDRSGNFLWATQMGRLGSEFEGSIAIDPAGSTDVYITGSFQGTSDFNPGEEKFDLISEGLSDIFISRLSDSGDFIWAKAMGGISQDYGTALAIKSGKNAGIYTVGNFRGTVDFCPGQDTCNISPIGGKDIFISKSDTSGSFQWAKVIKGTNDDYCHSIAIDDNCLYLTGFFPGTSISFDSFHMTNNNTSGTGADLFIAKLDFSVATTEIDPKTQQITIYPNPATNELNIMLEGDNYINGNITLYNSLGEIVYFTAGENMGQKKTIDINALPAGIYFIELNIDGNRVIEKVMRE